MGNGGIGGQGSLSRPEIYLLLVSTFLRTRQAEKNCFSNAFDFVVGKFK